MPTTRIVPAEVHFTEIVSVKRKGKYTRKGMKMIDVPIDSFTEDEAPVALIVKEGWYDNEDLYHCNEEPIRFVKGKLYKEWEALGEGCRFLFAKDPRLNPYRAARRKTQFFMVDQSVPVFEPLSIEVDGYPYHESCDYYDLEERVTADFQNQIDQLVFIGGKLWRTTPEPAYEVCRSELSIRCFNGEEEWDWYTFNANERESAMHRLAQASTYPIDPNHKDQIDVLIPEAVALPTNREKKEIKHMVIAVAHLHKAGKQLEKVKKAVYEHILEEKAEIEEEVRMKMLEVEQRSYRGYNIPTQDVLAEKVDEDFRKRFNRIMGHFHY